VLLNRFEERYENWDCIKEGFEGIRAQDVLSLITERFQCEKFIRFGNFIDIFVDRCFGHNFDIDLEWDRSLIDRVHMEDEACINVGTISPTHMIGIFVNELRVQLFYSSGVTHLNAIRKESQHE